MRKTVFLQVLFFVSLVTVLTITSSAATEAQEAPRPQYVAGEKWVFDKNGKPDEMVFAGYEGNSFIMRRTHNGKSWLRYYSLDGNPIKDTDENRNVIWEHRGEYAMFRFPLQVGKKWDELYYSHSRVARRMQVWVTAYEEVTVPAGTFWAFKLEAVNQRLDRARPSYETYWYAPAVKNIVKYSSPEFGVEMKLLQYVPAPAPTAKRNDP